MPASKHRSSGVNLGTKHICAHGFSWTTLYPDRTAAVLGERRPLATITVSGETLTGGQLEPFEVPIAVARNLDASNAPEPTSSAELLARVREAADACAWSRIVAMASRREHSSLEVARRLERDGYGPACVEGAVEHARNAGIVSDERFADSFVRAKLGAGWGPMRIERELSMRGVEPRELDGWPDEYLGDKGGVERAREVLRSRSVPTTNAYPKLVRFLASRGYSLAEASEATRARLDELKDVSVFEPDRSSD